ncbi:head-tail connector protein [Candidatus Pacearchaeota archaeon]|nr:head-tail connector protein [Candidatus Pacearchaeota archaeon]
MADKAAELIARMKTFESDRSNFDILYQDSTDYAMPNNNQVIDKSAPGQTRPDLFDTTAEESNIQLAAGLYSYMFPTDSRAFVLEIDDPELAEEDAVKQWLERVTNIVHKTLISSNFRESFFEFLKSLGCFGTACLYEEKGKKKPIVFVNHYMAGVYLARNSDGDVDTVFRKFEYTARQAVQEFTKEKLGTKVLAAFENAKHKNKKFQFIHALYPREDYDTTKDDPANMPVESTYVCIADKMIVSESGYKELPKQVAWFDKDSLEDYGRSPTMKKLPDIKMVNHMQKCRIKGWEKQVDPPIMTPDDGSIWPLATQPGGQIHYRAGGDKPEWFEFKGDLSRMDEAIKTVQQTIQKGYFIDMFDPLIDRQNMTATEVMARVEQKLRFLTPIIGRLQSGLFNPMIDRVIGILGDQKMLPEMPEELVDEDYNVMYLGRLALAMKTLETEGLTKTIAEWSPLSQAQVMTGWEDNLDVDQAFRDSARNNGVPATWLMAVKKRDLNRAQERAALQQQQAIESAPDLTKSVKNLSTKPEEGSPAQELINAA